MLEENNLPNFEQAVLPHLDAAYNLARWLTHNDQDAQDAVQDACLRAFRFFPSFHGGDARPWLMKIVRNACYTLLMRAVRCRMPWNLTRKFSLLILIFPIRKKFYFKAIAVLCCEKRWKSYLLISVKFLFSAKSRRCPTGRSQRSPVCLRAR